MTEAERQELDWIRFRLRALADRRLQGSLLPPEQEEWRKLAEREVELLAIDRGDDA